MSEVKKQIEALPITSTYAIVNALEKLLFQFVLTEYDRELTCEVVEHFQAKLELHKFSDEMERFVDERKEKIDHIFKEYAQDPGRHLFLFQPESLLLFYLIETQGHFLYTHWEEKFPVGELEGLAVVWGMPYSYDSYE